MNEEFVWMKGSKTVLAILLILSIVSVSFWIPQVKGDLDSVFLVPSPYTGTQVYTPGETMDIVLRGDAGDVYSVYTSIANAVIDSSVPLVGGEATVSYPINEVTPDGVYSIIVKDVNEVEVGNVTFTVQAYAFLIETDRDAYLDGDVMKIFWTANNLRDQSLPPIGNAWISVYNETMKLFEQTLNTSAGSFSFPLPSIIYDYDEQYWVQGFFNDLKYPPERSQFARANFSVKRLGVLIDLDKEQYTVGSLLSIQVKTVVTYNQSYPVELDTAEPGCSIDIKIFKMPNQVDPIEVSDILQTDSHGIVRHIVALDGQDYTDGSDYLVKVQASKGFREISEEVIFKISVSSSLSVVLDFDKTEYTSGDSIYVNASASSIGGGSEFTFLFEIRDGNSTGTLFSRNTQSASSFEFEIPSNFVEGFLWIRVTADDGLGNSASVVQTVKVAYAIVLVNVNKENYVANEEITVSYDVISEKMTNPETYYIVEDNEGNTVDEGVAVGGSFSYTIPTAPSKKYMFTVIATELGKMVQGHDTAELYSSYVLTIEFNSNNYKTGSVMVIDYRILTLGDAILPATFVISYGLVNGPLISLQTSSAVGQLTYTIPEGIDEGEQLFMASCDFGGNVNEVVTIRDDANPLWYLTIRDIPIFNILLTLLVLFLWYSLWRTRKKITEVQKAGLHNAEKSRRPPQDASASVTECVECSNPIEITTSRRPIEVMCPHCGEIQHIEK